MTAVRVARRDRFTVIDQQTVNDKQLSFRARGILVWLLDKPDDWTSSIPSITGQGTEGRDAVAKALRELEDCGYIERRRFHAEGGTWAHELVVHERPHHERVSSGWSDQGVCDETAGGTADGKPGDGFPGDIPTTQTKDVEPTTNRMANGCAVPGEADASPSSSDVPVLIDSLLTWSVPAVVVEGGWLEPAVELCEVLATSLRDRGERVAGTTPVSKGWVLPMESMLRVDGRTPHEVLKVIRWLDGGRDRTSQFWRTNIRSPKKLRQHYARMAEQYQRDRAPAQRNAVLADAAATGPSIESVYEGARRWRERGNGPG